MRPRTSLEEGQTWDALSKKSKGEEGSMLGGEQRKINFG